MADFPPLRKHLFLTGRKQVGKSTLLRRLIQTCGLSCTGFETRALYLDGVRRGFTLHGFAELDAWENDCIISVRISQRQSIPVLPAFNENGVRMLQASLDADAPFLLMDELGRLEREADAFCAQVLTCLDSSKRVLGVLQQCDAPLLRTIAQREDVTVLTVTPENRDELFQQLITSGFPCRSI